MNYSNDYPRGTWDLISLIKKSVYVVFTGTYAGCYTSHDDACEAAWDSDEPVREYSSLSAAQYALKRFTKR